MRYRASCVLPRSYGTCFYLLKVPGRVQWNISINRTYCSPKQNPQDKADKSTSTQDRASTTLKNVAEIGKQWGQNSVRTMTTTVNYWWAKYEEFVGLNEVRDAQSKVTELSEIQNFPHFHQTGFRMGDTGHRFTPQAEKAFMVARGMVREAHVSLEALQVRLKEVRDRLDRVSREEAHYLELATLEHKLLQEERRLKTTYENAEECEREKFALFSAGVRESHEKERSRAERTKNWSVIGSVLGAIIGVMGSTYVNRVRLQELKGLLLEAQKGPASLQEAIKIQASSHKNQQEELRGLIDAFRVAVKGGGIEAQSVKPRSVLVPAAVPVATPPSTRGASEEAVKEILLHSQKAQALMEDLKPQLHQLEQSVGKVATELHAVRKSVVTRPVEKPVIQTKDTQLLVCDTESIIQGLDQTEKRLEAQINKTTLYTTVLTYTAFALTMPVLYVIFKGS